MAARLSPSLLGELRAHPKAPGWIEGKGTQVGEEEMVMGGEKGKEREGRGKSGDGKGEVKGR